VTGGISRAGASLLWHTLRSVISQVHPCVSQLVPGGSTHSLVSQVQCLRRAGAVAPGKGGKERLITIDRFSWTSPEC